MLKYNISSKNVLTLPFEMLEWMLEVIGSQKSNMEKLTSALEVVTSWKGFIYSEDEPKTNTKEKQFLDVFEKMKNNFN